MRLATTPESMVELSKALRLMTDALVILDDLGVPAEIGGMLDLAAVRLGKVLVPADGAKTDVEHQIARLERELGMARPRGQHEASPWDATPCP